MYSIRQFSAFYSHSRWLLVKWRHLRVTSGHLRSRDIISRHVTASSCKLQPCRKWNAQYTPVFGLLQPLQGDFRSNHVTSRHLRSRDVISCHVTASSASYSLVGSDTHSIRVISPLQPLQGDFRSNDVTSGSLSVTWGHVTSFPVTWLPPPAIYSLVGSEMYSIHQFSAFSHFQVTSGQMASLPGHFRLLEVTWRHFLSRDCLLLQTTAS